MVNLHGITLLCSIAVSLLVVISILGLAHLTVNNNLDADQNNVRTSLQNENPSIGSIKILNHQMTKPILGNEIVKGQIKNTGSGQIRYATIKVNFYKDGNLIYSGSINLNDIASGETSSFEVTYEGPDDSPDSYDIALGPSL